MSYASEDQSGIFSTSSGRWSPRVIGSDPTHALVVAEHTSARPDLLERLSHSERTVGGHGRLGHLEGLAEGRDLEAVSAER